MIILRIKRIFNYENNIDNYIELYTNIISDINKYFQVERKNNETEKYIEKKLKENVSKEKLSCRKSSHLYFEDKGKSISKTYINNLLNNLGLSYLKSTI